MLSGEKILVTGVTGKIAFGLARALAHDNEVWGIARFSNPESRQVLEDLGVTTRAVDLAKCDLSGLPRDFTRLLHLAVSYEPGTFDQAISVNAEPAGFLLEHCRNAKSALVMSTVTVYKAHPDPWYRFREDDPLGDAAGPDTHAGSYAIAKIAEEAITRYCARAFDLPVTIARMNCAYSERGGLPMNHVQAMIDGKIIRPRWDPLPYSVIHEDDIADQVEALLNAASVPATIVNWCGDEAVPVQDWVRYVSELTGLEAKIETTKIPGSTLGTGADPAKRMAITGPCKVHWKDGLRRSIAARFPGLIRDLAK